jgi:PP-loop superfamily ATP-utilizing enzyme
MFDSEKISEVDSKLKELGFKHIALDLSGYNNRENFKNPSYNNSS